MASRPARKIATENRLTKIEDFSPDHNVYVDFKNLTNKLDRVADFLGLNVTLLTYEMDWRTYTIVILAVVFFTGTGYTVYQGLVVEKNYIVLLQSACQAGAGVQSVTKLFIFLKYRKILWELLDLMHATFQHDIQGDNFRKSLQSDMQDIIRIIKMFAVIYTITIFACIMFPIPYYIMYTKRIMIMQFLVPGLDPNTDYGYYILNFVHFNCMFLGLFGNYAADMYLFFCIYAAPVAKNVLRCKMQDLDAKLEHLQPQSNLSSQDVHDDMVDIVVWHQKYMRILECTESMFFVIIFVQVVTCCVSNMSILYCILVGVWPAGKVYLIYSVTTFLLYCVLGTIIDNSNQDLTEIVYNCRWYDLPVIEQRTLLFMLRRSQATKGLSVGKMMPLNMQTAMQLSKTTYSVLMLLMQGRNGDD